jgi:HAD superfamily hydrolase (TIGR01509 family)
MIKLIVFDLDGVLLDSCDMHYNVLNKAIQETIGQDYVISQKDHDTTFNGLNTKAKLKLLSELRDLDESKQHIIYTRKQDLTMDAIEDIKYDLQKIEMLKELRKQGYILHCASNSIRRTLEKILKNLGIYELFDLILSNEDVKNPKPSGEIYFRCIMEAGVSAEQTLIVEDSYIGVTAARQTNANILLVKSSEKTTIERVTETIKYYEDKKSGIPKRTLFQKRINVVIPMAGDGSRFAKVGYKDPKPMIDVFGKPMISWVVENMEIDANYIFVVKQQHEQRYNLRKILKSIVPECKIVEVKETTQGAACTVLLAEHYIDNDLPLLMANSDQWLEWDCEQFVLDFLLRDKSHSVRISTFPSDGSPKWSYAATDENGYVTDVKEKQPISNHGSTGVYLWRRGCDFVKYAKQMISLNKRTRGEFYVAPVIKEAIDDGHLVSIDNCKRFWSLGVPDDLDSFHENYRNE